MTEQRFPIPVGGGTLYLVETQGDLDDVLLPGSLVLSMVTRRRFEYQGELPKDMGLELVRQSPGGGRDVTVDGRPLIEYLERL